MKSTTNRLLTIVTWGSLGLAIMALGLIAWGKISSEIFLAVFVVFSNIASFLFGKKGAKVDSHALQKDPETPETAPTEAPKKGLDELVEVLGKVKQ